MPDEPDDIRRHIEQMKAEIEALGGQTGKIEEMPPELEEQFLAEILEFENAPLVKHRELLERDGVTLPAPDELTDDQLPLKLIEIVQAMARRRTYLYNTDHLSDRELYAYLLDDVFEEEVPDLPLTNPMRTHIDLVSSGSDQAVDAWLRYYADDETRAKWQEDFPEYEMPPQEDPPYDRDHQLPEPEDGV